MAVVRFALNPRAQLADSRSMKSVAALGFQIPARHIGAATTLTSTRWPAQCTLPHALPLGRWVVGRPTRWLRHRSLAPSRLGPIGVARVDREPRLAKGEIGAAIDVPRANGSPFSADHPP